MRRFSSASLAGLAFILVFTAIWSGCGGGGSNNTFTITKYVWSPTVISMEPGQVVAVTATPYNASGTVVSATVTYTLTNGNQLGPNLSISPGGTVCAGTWDAATYTVCTVGKSPQVGQFQIEATANGATTKTTVYVHYHVDAVYMHAPGTSCTSMGKTAGVTASACTTPADSYNTCTAGTCSDNPGLCDVSSSVGQFNYGVVDSTVASIDSTGTLTAGVPGTTKLYASVTSGGVGTVSAAVPYTTCLVDSISLHQQSQTATSVSVAKSASATLQADVLDTAGTTITPNLTYNDLQSVVGSVASGATGTATYSGLAPGYGGVVASCTPPNCNKNASTVFSNVVTTTVQNSTSDTGVTANETNVYVTGLGAVQMYPVDTTKFTLGSVVSLPYSPNSMMMGPDGQHIFLGSNTYGMVVATASNSVSTLGFPGKILAVAPNNAYVIWANTDTTKSPATGSVYIMAGSSLTIANAGGFSIPGVTAAGFTPDGNTVYFAAGSNLYRYRIIGDSGSNPAPLTLTPGGSPLNGATANDLTTSANGTILFTGTSAKIVTNETCNALVSNQYTTAFEPLPSANSFGSTTIAALPNGSGVLSVNGTSLDELTITNPNPLTAPFAGCPATGFATSPATISLSGLGSGFTVNQLIMSHSGHYAAVVTGCSGGGCTPQVGIIDLTKGTVTAVPLVDGVTTPLTQVYSGSWMLDDSGLWVTADDSYIHFIDVTKLADSQDVQVQIQGPGTGGTPNFVNPTFIAVQPK